MDVPEYLYLSPIRPLPELHCEPYRAVVIIEIPVTADWRGRVSDWLVKSGCLYMMAWGLDCSLWDDSVDYANLDEFEYNDIPDDRFVMTTWHEKESLQDVFWYCKHTARHPTVDLKRTFLIHVSPVKRKQELLSEYQQAR